MHILKIALLGFYIFWPAISYAEPPEILGFNFDTETIESFIKKAEIQGASVQQFTPGDLDAPSGYGVFPATSREVGATFTSGMRENPLVYFINAKFIRAGALAHMRITLHGDNELLGVRRSIIEKYPEVKVLSKWQKGALDNEGPLSAYNCNHWMDDGVLQVCVTGAYPKGNVGKNCMSRNDATPCERELSISYAYKPLKDKHLLEQQSWKDMEGEKKSAISKLKSKGL